MSQQNEMMSERKRVVALIQYYGRNHGAFMHSLQLAVESGGYIRDEKYHCGCGQLIEFGGPQHICSGDRKSESKG